MCHRSFKSSYPTSRCNSNGCEPVPTVVAPAASGCRDTVRGGEAASLRNSCPWRSGESAAACRSTVSFLHRCRSRGKLGHGVRLAAYAITSVAEPAASICIPTAGKRITTHAALCWRAYSWLLERNERVASRSVWTPWNGGLDAARSEWTPWQTGPGAAYNQKEQQQDPPDPSCSTWSTWWWWSTWSSTQPGDCVRSTPSTRRWISVSKKSGEVQGSQPSFSCLVLLVCCMISVARGQSRCVVRSICKSRCVTWPYWLCAYDTVHVDMFGSQPMVWKQNKITMPSFNVVY